MLDVAATPLKVAVVALAVIAAAAVSAQPTPHQEYEIGPGDVLKVVVIGQAQMTGDFAVDPEGMVNFPILGKIKASQHTTLELERKITTLLSDGILRRPQVTVSVSEYGSQRVFVTGEVQRPGRYPLKADRSLLTLLGDIGALSPNVGHEVIVIRPPELAGAASAAPATAAGSMSMADPPPAATSPATSAPQAEISQTSSVPGLPFVAPGSQVVHISLLELQSGNPEKNIALKAGDTVYFPKASQVYVMGSVARPGPVRYQEGMTVLQALTLAGGVTDRGSQGRAKVVRIVDGKTVEKKVKATDIVQPEDTLVIPERFF
jgi:polysaccharide export outer membrane protein